MIDKLKQLRWKGYKRGDGSIGIRNKVLVLYTVECAHHVARKIADRFDDQVDVIGFTGCTDNEYAVRMLLAMTRHPNVGAVLTVGLGCEYVQPAKIADYAAEHHRLAESFFIQDVGGTKKGIAKGVAIVARFLEQLAHTETTAMGFEDLVVGCECGGSDYTSGLSGNVVVGRFFDRSVELNATVIFEEIVEGIGLKDILVKRGADDHIRQMIADTYEKAVRYCKRVGQYSISPGNFVGGLTTIEEKSMGAIIKSGSKPVNGVIKVSQSPPAKGLYLLDSVPDEGSIDFGITNPNDNEGIMDLISAGSHVVFLVTGRGNVVGSAVAPVVKITGNRETFTKLADDMDFCTADLLDGSRSLDDITEQLFSLVAAIASGQQSKAEELGHSEYYIHYKYQDYQSAAKRCGDAR